MQPDLPWRALEASDEPSTDDGVAKPPAGRDRRATLLLGAGVLGLALVVLAAVAMLAVGAPGQATPPLVVDARADGAAAGSPAARPTASGSPTARELVVDVGGAVLRPGVYRLPAGSRVADAIAAAGGYGPRVDAAAAGRLNLAAPVADGAQVWVPSRDDAAGTPGGSGAPAPGGTQAGGGASVPINVNTASADELDTLPGVGPATAAKIIAARAERPFASVEELRDRKIVSATTFSKLAGLVTVGK